MGGPGPEVVNPYAAPRAAASDPASSAEPAGGGFWDDGRALVVHRQARLPDRCLRCNAPASRRLRKTLHWHHPAWYLLILLHVFVYVVAALIVRKRLSTELPLCETHWRRRVVGLVIGWVGSLTFLGLMFLGFALASAQEGSEGWLAVGLLSVLGWVSSLIVGGALATVAKPTRIGDTHAWLKVGRAFRRACPPLPTSG